MSDQLNSPLAGFFDDAAVFPPGSAPLGKAVRQHLERRETPFAALTGPLLLPLGKIMEAQRLAVSTAAHLGIDLSEAPLEIGLIVPAGELVTALKLAEKDLAGVTFTGLELKTSPDSWSQELEELQQVDTSLARHAEFNSTQVMEGALSALQGSAVGLKVRTGGLEARMFPTTTELAAILSEAAQREIPFKLTAGLHRGLRHTNLETGFTHHGFLNIAAATYAAAGGAEVDEVDRCLAITDPGQLIVLVRNMPVHTWRTWFRSFGTCSIPWNPSMNSDLSSRSSAVSG